MAPLNGPTFPLIKLAKKLKGPLLIFQHEKFTVSIN